ncbi:MAG TPA: molybdopterin cofactor-binding domain-containing protein [Candidatus Limnocylindria bacterium]|jgi:isoquinoline 1-oxidoreductase beta subunit|nr:molybdopterin cofactor-binding domain-containing protein [Candidatus Limnocylindria bacterium]
MQRSTFLASAGAALVLGAYAPVRGVAANAQAANEATLSPSAWLRIGEDDTVTAILGKSEMGQGVTTSLPMLIAEELHYPVDRIRVEFAPVDPAFADPLLQGQTTGGSTTIKGLFDPLRTAGARARTMLITAAAQRWNVPASECTAQNGTVVHAGSQRSARYGELVADAAKLPLPEHVELASPDTWTVLGKPHRRTDALAKSTGRTQFGIDVRLPGMLIATVAKPPSVTGKVVGYDAAAAKQVHGVRAVVPISSGIAVVADNYFAAQQGKRALKARFSAGANAPSTAQMTAQALALTKVPGVGGPPKGDPAAAIAGAAQKHAATYTAPFLAHATMEPMNATAHVSAAGVEVWAPTQNQSAAQATIAKAAGVPPSKITLHTTYLGGGFGRRLETDFIQDAVEVAKAVHAPVKVIWSREDDTQHDYYRPSTANALAAGLDAQGKIVGMTYRVVSPSVSKRALPPLYKNGFDPLAMSNAGESLYAIPNYHADYHDQETGVPVGFWRAPYASANAWAAESFIDELATLAKQDPLAFRLANLPAVSRARTVLETAAKQAGWGTPTAAGVHRGIALATWDDSLIATVAEVSLDGKRPRVHRLVSAVDCGTVVNPLTLEAQVESAMIYGLSAALTGKVTFTSGVADQHNFDTYTVVRMGESPRMEVTIVPSREKPSGGGEIGTPPVAAAVTNALFAATGKRIRTLPISDALA